MRLINAQFLNQNNQYEQTKNSTKESKRTLCSRKHQTNVCFHHCINRIFNYRNPSKHLTMNAIETFIYTLETQLKTMPDGYTKQTVVACKELAEGINAIYENANNNISQPTNKD